MLVDTLGFCDKFAHLFTKNFISLFRWFFKSQVKIIHTYVIPRCPLHEEANLQYTIHGSGPHFILAGQVDFGLVFVGIYPNSCLLSTGITLFDVLRNNAYCVSPGRQICGNLFNLPIAHMVSPAPRLDIIIAYFQGKGIVPLSSHHPKFPTGGLFLEAGIDNALRHVRLCMQRQGRTHEER